MKKSQERTETKILTKNIIPQDQGRYIEVEFNMPSNIERIHVAMEVDQLDDTGSVIDLGLRDPYRARGWSGGARSEFYITNHKATPGYLDGNLFEGEWAILLGAYRVSSSGCKVTLTIELTFQSYQWFGGDLHLHSIHSDGVYTIEENIEIATSLNLNFIALTDHNTVSQNFVFPKNTDLLIIPGMELTTNRGHLNLFDVRDPVMDFRVNSDDELEFRLKEARDNGAKVSLNHPFCSHTGWEWEWDFDYDFVEVWNGPWREDNQKAVDWWHNQLITGRKVVAIAGSDTHRPDPFVKHGMPTTWIYSHSLTRNSLMEAMLKGHVVLSYAPSGPFIQLTCGSNMTGDVCIQPKEEINVEIHHLHYGDIIKTYSHNGLEEKMKIVEGQNEIEFSREVGERRFFRVEVWRYFPEVDDYLMASLSNPIYFCV